ncbi:Uncharacterized protein APZ42_015204 [Daphnia magna]|uniref:Protein sleepless n=1 Tax=Daphnia magna TaxID=35525 RepID=A0A162P9Y5_9CRUS|nr:Uncharacterized protein APZ42_015204 [Daphnia magna]
MNRHHHPPHPSVASFQTAGLLTSICFLFILPQFFMTTVNAIDCFKCVSVNGANPACEDPFHNNFTSDLLESPCLGGRKGRNGLFPATACLKLAGRYGTIIIINYTHHQITGLLLPRPRPFFFIGGSRIFCRA